MSGSLDLGFLRAHIKLEGKEEFKRDVEESTNSTKTFSSFVGGGLKTALGAVGKGLLATGASAAAGFGAMAKEALGAYSQTEQLKGGIATLYGDSAQAVIENANNAFATTGLTANEYMEQVSSYSASLLQSLGGDTEQASKVADMALKDMADNASVFGSDMESIQSAYQGFAKQNYTMLDNLKLGYGGTKTEMERLLEDAGKLTGQKYDIENLNDVYEAIHAIQEEQKITGNSAREASKTIEGSLSATKAA